MPVLVSNKHPSQPARRSFHHVPRVEGVEDRVPEAPVPPGIDRDGGGGAVLKAVAAAGVTGSSMFEGVGFPVEGEDVQNGEKCHFDAEQNRRNAGVNIGVAKLLRWLKGPV